MAKRTKPGPGGTMAAGNLKWNERAYKADAKNSMATAVGSKERVFLGGSTATDALRAQKNATTAANMFKTVYGFKPAKKK